MTDTILVSNPAYEPGHPEEIALVEVRMALRDDPLGRLYTRRQIGHAQFLAGRVWQAAYEASSIGHMGSVDPSNEPVDGSPRTRGPNIDRVRLARCNLIRWDHVLGVDGAGIVRDVLAERRSIEQAAARRGACVRSALDYYGRRFRECLLALARDMGYVT